MFYFKPLQIWSSCVQCECSISQTLYTNTVDSPRGLQRLAVDLHRPSSSLGLVRIFTAINTSTRNRNNRSLYDYSKLSPIELQWRDLSDFLESKGYVLRPRYRKGWTPSWLLPESKHRGAEQFEDHIPLPDTVRHDILCLSSSHLIIISVVA